MRHPLRKRIPSTPADQLLLIARKIGKLATYCGRIKDKASMIRVESERRDAKKNATRSK